MHGGAKKQKKKNIVAPLNAQSDRNVRRDDDDRRERSIHMGENERICQSISLSLFHRHTQRRLHCARAGQQS